jgi:uncharacterized protein (DUF1800 family)
MPTTMTTADVARLLGRVAFGATAADLDLWTGKEYADLVDFLLAPAKLPVQVPHTDESQRVAMEADELTEAPDARRWWLERMRTTPAPLVERMTLFWHGHFATAVKFPPNVAEVLKQNDTLRTHALGNVFDLVCAMSVDPAMLFWLNGFQNTPPKANENYAREFFELFTLGKRPQVYTEKDIREAARAFTCWSVSAEDTAVFNAGQHDKRTKRILGTTVGDLGAEEHRKVAEIALAQPVASRFIAWKLVANLAYTIDSPNLLRSKDALLAKVSKSLRDSGWDMAVAVRTLLMADEFRYAPPSRRLVRQPVETIVHAAKALDVQFADLSLVWLLDRMGQSLFEPSNVGGWPMGRDWISPVSAMARYDAALALHRAAAKPANNALRPRPAPDDLPGWAARLGLAGFGTTTANAVNAYLRRTDKATIADRQAGVLALLLSSPEWVVF